MNKVKLKEIAKIDVSNVDKKSKDGEKRVKLCNFIDVYKNWRITSDLEPTFMIATAPQRHIDRFTIHKGQVAITKDSETRDDIGLSTYIAEDIPNTLLGYHCVLISPNEDVLSGEYLNLVLQSEYAHKYFELNASGSGQRYTLTNDTVKNMPIPIVDLEYQRKLGDVFTNIDKKIKINNKIIETSEKLLREVYEYWFIQFDFPDENGHPYKSSGGEMVYNETLKREIPKGWNIKRVDELCEVKTGKEDANFAVPDGDYKFFTCADEPLRCNIPCFNGKSILIAGNGNFNVKHYDGNFNAYQRTYVLQPNDTFYGITFIEAKNRTELFTKGSNGSIVKFITKGDVGSIRIFVSSKAIELYETFNTILAKIDTVRNENEKLASLRDWLLPMLMNGQVRVTE